MEYILPNIPAHKIVRTVKDEQPAGGMYLYTTNTTYFITPTVLGTGSFSTVKLGYYHLTNVKHDEVKKAAIKIIPKSIMTPERIKAVNREIEVLQALKSSNVAVIQLIESLEDETSLYLIFDSQENDLYTYYLNRGKISETEMMLIFPQMVDAVMACHSRGIVHRDLKLENFLYNTSPIQVGNNQNSFNYLNIVLADFGFSTFFESENQKFTKWCGSTYTVAPEILQHTPYKPKPVDVWGLGCILYTLLCGYPPFKGRNVTRTFERTKKGQMRSFAGDLGESVKDLIKKMLMVNPEQRITLEEVKEHPWYRLAVGVKRRYSLGKKPAAAAAATNGAEGPIDLMENLKRIRGVRVIEKEKRTMRKEMRIANSIGNKKPVKRSRSLLE